MTKETKYWVGMVVASAAIGLGITVWKKHKEEKFNRELRSFNKALKERNDSVMKQVTEQYKPEPSPEAKNRGALENELTKLLGQRNAARKQLNEAIKKNILELQEKQRKEKAAIALEKESELAEQPRGVLSVSDRKQLNEAIKKNILELQEKQRKEKAAIALEKESELAEQPRGVLSVSDLWNEWRMMQSKKSKRR